MNYPWIIKFASTVIKPFLTLNLPVLVIFVPFAGLDIVGILHSASRQDMVRLTIKILEKNMEVAKETGGNQVVVVFDMDGWNIRQYAWRPGKPYCLFSYELQCVFIKANVATISYAQFKLNESSHLDLLTS